MICTYTVDSPGMGVDPEYTCDTDPAVATVWGYVVLVLLVGVGLWGK